MSHYKIESMHKLWKANGYDIKTTEERIYKGEVMEVVVEVNVQGRELQPMFSSHWKTMKKLARTHQFYILALNEGDSKVILFNNKLFSNVSKQLMEIWSDYEQSYWYAQGHDDMRYICMMLLKQAAFINRLNTNVNKMGKCDYDTQIQLQQTVYPRFHKFRSSLKMLMDRISSSGLMTNEETKQLEDLIKRFYDKD